LSETDSFVEEVTEEMRRDRLFGFFKKWGWLIALALLLIIGGAIFNEWRKGSVQAGREAAGDALLSALGHAAALAEADQDAEALAVYDEIAADVHIANGDTDAALADLTSILEAPMTSPELRQRAQQMTIVLGGEVPNSPVQLSTEENG